MVRQGAYVHGARGGDGALIMNQYEVTSGEEEEALKSPLTRLITIRVTIKEETATIYKQRTKNKTARVERVPLERSSGHRSTRAPSARAVERSAVT